MRVALLAVLAVLGAAAELRGQASDAAVVLVTIDGVRWQEVFTGAAEELMTREQGVDDPDRLRRDYWRASPHERRAALMPFLWDEFASNGAILGDAARPVRVTNGKNFSYPGYSELLAGFADGRIASNAKRTNPNVTVLEWLSRQPGFARRIDVVGSWDVFPWILAVERSHLPVNAGWTRFDLAPETPAQRMLNRLMMSTTREWESVRFDSFTAAIALELLARRKPRVLYVALGEPDDWAHARRYDRYLDTIHEADCFLFELWSGLEAMPEYAGKTTLLVTTDHGRGSTPEDWTGHGADVDGADRVWIAALGPALSRPAVGGESTLAQIAASVARAVGLDWVAAEPRAAPPLAVLGPVDSAGRR